MFCRALARFVDLVTFVMGLVMCYAFGRRVRMWVRRIVVLIVRMGFCRLRRFGCMFEDGLLDVRLMS